MAMHILVWRNYGRKSLVSIKCYTFHSFKGVVILLGQRILEIRQVSHLHGSAFFTILLRVHQQMQMPTREQMSTKT